MTKLIPAAAAAALLVGTGSLVEAAERRTAKAPTVAKPSSKAAADSTRARRGKSRRSAARRSQTPRQAAPTTERYKEIQQALAEKGFYSGPVNGEWGPESVEALKRFQASENLASDGKLGALSLIALGLGPKRDAMADLAARPASDPPEAP